MIKLAHMVLKGVICVHNVKNQKTWFCAFSRKCMHIFLLICIKCTHFQKMRENARIFGKCAHFRKTLTREGNRKGDIVKQPMKKDSFVPKNVPGVGWGGVGHVGVGWGWVGWGGVGHVGVGWGGVGWVM